MTAFVLKIIAVISMVIDHTGLMLNDHRLISWDVYIFMRTLGRFAFPIYAFLLAEGFRHLRNEEIRLKKHVLLLLVLAALSEAFYDRIGHGAFHYPESQSVIFTLLFAFLGLWISEAYRDRPLLRFLVWLPPMALAYLVNTDYGPAGVLLVFAGSVYLEHCETWGMGSRLLGVLAVMCVYYGFYMWAGVRFGSPEAAWNRFIAMDVYNYPHLLLVPILAAYTGKRGPRNRPLHRCYQWFYPAHLAVLCLISGLLK